MRATTQKKIEAIRNRLHGYYEMLSDLSSQIEDQASDCPNTDRGDNRRETLEDEAATVSDLAESLYNIVDEIDSLHEAA